MREYGFIGSEFGQAGEILSLRLMYNYYKAVFGNRNVAVGFAYIVIGLFYISEIRSIVVFGYKNRVF